jgi:hypothetical protein
VRTIAICGTHVNTKFSTVTVPAGWSINVLGNEANADVLRVRQRFASTIWVTLEPGFWVPHPLNGPVFLQSIRFSPANHLSVQPTNWIAVRPQQELQMSIPSAWPRR